MRVTPTVGQALAQSGLVPVDAQVLLAHAVGRNRAWLAAHRDDVLTGAQATDFFELARRRRDGEPVAYLTAVREFWGLELHVSPQVLIPRPETETLVELALEWLPHDAAARIADLGTGSGAIALALASERPQALVVATDASAAALEIAQENARRLAVRNVVFARSDWYSDIDSAPFAMIVCNPPYVASGDAHLSEGDLRFEPAAALVSGVDGLAALRQIVAGAPSHLAPGGALVVEHGYDQSEAVVELLRAAGFGGIVVRRDLAGIARVAAGRLVRDRYRAARRAAAG
ncbi:MAG: peptide chain release factor N(5)-glutamine methyltransferase [Burkholderiales bacterium]|nr:peptide chain release factor N(5)-glutamine methyltransferase [Burkholderiales bacterium]